MNHHALHCISDYGFMQISLSFPILFSVEETHQSTKYLQESETIS